MTIIAVERVTVGDHESQSTAGGLLGSVCEQSIGGQTAKSRKRIEGRPAEGVALLLPELPEVR